MSKLSRASSCALGALLLQACAVPVPVRHMLFQPAQQVRHSANETAASYFDVGRYHHERGDLDLALNAYTYAIARDPRFAEARIAAAVIHATQGRLGQAQAMLVGVVAEYPQLAQARTNLGYVYYLEGDYSSAMASLQKAVSLDSTNSLARNNLQLAEQAQAHRSAAAASLGPSSPTAVVTTVLAPVPQDSSRSATPPMLTALSQVPPASTTRAEARLEVANGNGVTGMAARVTQALGKQGITVSRLTNVRPFSHQTTSIEFRTGFEHQARALHSALRGRAVLIETAVMETRTDVRLVLGRDAGTRLILVHAPIRSDQIGQRTQVGAL